MTDENGESIEKLDHCRKGFLHTSVPLKKGYILRAESDVKEVK